MGVPAFFRWLTKKYPSVVADCVEDRPKQLPNGKFLPVDASQKNPNNVEFHNLYLDMNGIIHPCTHPEDRPAPKNEDEMMIAIFEFIDRIFAIVRPRRLLYMAIDGVAPRAKMNQQRSRRFRASKEIGEKVQEMARIKEELEGRGAYVPPQKEKGEHFDSNCITPGTPFMHRLSACLHYYVHDRLRNDPAWKNITVILSDANVPGEGEHKIMDYIRRQRVQKTHDANTQHVLCGADADLIMLGLATHEPNFTIIREEFKPNKPRPCDICGQLGHEMKDCQGAEREKSGEHDEIGPSIAAEQNFIFVKLNVLREYLERDLQMSRLPQGFTYDLERAIDDWVFMCFFVGNDFLPHLPSLEIRENAIDRLITLYKETVYKTGKWVTDSGFVDLECVQMILTDLGHAEDEIFKKRQENELVFRRRQQNNKRGRYGGVHEGRPAFLPQGQFAPRAVGRGYNNPSVRNAHQEIQQGRIQAFVRASNGAIPQNNEAAAALRAMLRSSDGAIDSDKPAEQQQETSPAPSGAGAGGVKRKHGDDEDDEFSHDEVRLWEDGFKDRYYESKFAVSQSDEAFRSKVACEYVRGLCWVLQYYYQGVPSWKWYFPYHYAPFASDCTDISSVRTVFKKGTKPFRPLEQLMGVFPAASGSHVPSAWAELMKDPESPIIDFYPEDFKIDLNGKKFAWQGVALLPFVDEKRLKRAVKPLFEHLTEDEKRRNMRGEDLIFVGKHHSAYDFLRGLVENSAEDDETPIALDPECIYGISGHVFRSDLCVEPGGSLDTPVQGLETIYDCHVVCMKYRDPIPDDPNFKYPACRLATAVAPAPHLKPGDYEERTGRNWTPRTGMTVPFQRGHLGAGGHRMMQHHVRPHTPHPFPRQSGPRMGAAAFFDNNSSDHRQMSRGGQHGGRGGDWNRSSNESGGRGGWGSSANAYPPPQEDYRRQQHGGGGYGNHQNRYNNQSGPPSSSNIRGNEYGQQGRGSHQQPHYPPHNQQQPPRRPPPQNNSGGGGGGGGYGYYTSGYQGQRY